MQKPQHLWNIKFSYCVMLFVIPRCWSGFGWPAKCFSVYFDKVISLAMLCLLHIIQNVKLHMYVSPNAHWLFSIVIGYFWYITNIVSDLTFFMSHSSAGYMLEIIPGLICQLDRLYLLRAKANWVSGIRLDWNWEEEDNSSLGWGF